MLYKMKLLWTLKVLNDVHVKMWYWHGYWKVWLLYIYIMNDVNYNDDWKYWLTYMLNNMEIDMTLWKCWLNHEWWDYYDYGNEYGTCWKVWLAYASNKVNIELFNDIWMMSRDNMKVQDTWTEIEKVIKRLLNIVLHILCALHTT